ncbi:MAG: hypothetical protein DRP97_02260 [Candidatus Latescibacterota bacterium]|nr:MAG: hypothetical protein DRP97_02260 [Candidatus Latescibacterota bacterium]
MININLGTNKTKRTPVTNIINNTIKPEMLTEILDNLNTLAKTFTDKNIYTLQDLVNTISKVNLKYLNGITKFKLINMVITITNNPLLSTDYSYLVTMFKNMRDEWGPTYDGNETAFELTITIDPISSPTMSIEEVFVILFNVLGYEQTVTTINSILPYDYLD